MNKTKMLQWIGTHHVGISSRTMWCALMGVANSETPTYYGFDTPYDWDDFSRCYDLVVYGEVTKEELQVVIEAFPFYKPIIDRWDELVEAYLSPGGKGVYRILDSVYSEVMGLKGYVNLGGGLYGKQL